MAQYRARVNRLCRQERAYLDDLGDPSTADQIERYLRQTLAYSRKREPLYEALRPPSELRADHGAFLQVSRTFESEVEDVLERIDAGGDPVAAFTEAARPLLRLADRGNRLARRMRVNDCVVPIPDPAAQQPQQTY